MRQWSSWLGGLLLAIALAVDGVSAQSTPSADKRPAFGVASVKPNNSGDIGINNRFTPTQVSYTNAPVRLLITTAYEITSDRLLGGPAWIGSERFDFAATVTVGATFPEIRLMMQRLLEERFALKIRREVRELPIYLLVKAREDGRLGAGLQPSSLDCSRRDPANPASSPCRTAVKLNTIDGRGILWTTFNLQGYLIPAGT
jgi:uncharacterized protein (TIGR03435 family)